MECIYSQLPVIIAADELLSNIIFCSSDLFYHTICCYNSIQETVGSDNLPRLVKNRGPLTKKVVASGSHFPGLEFSL